MVLPSLWISRAGYCSEWLCLCLVVILAVAGAAWEGTMPFAMLSDPLLRSWPLLAFCCHFSSDKRDKVSPPEPAPPLAAVSCPGPVFQHPERWTTRNPCAESPEQRGSCCPMCALLPCGKVCLSSLNGAMAARASGLMLQLWGSKSV